MASSSGSKQWIYAVRPEKEVSAANYRLETVPVPTNDDLKDGEVLLRTLFCSVDPYMRIQQSANDTWEAPHPLGTVQGGGTIGQVVASKHEGVAVGSIVSAYTGWREHAITSGDSVTVITWDGAVVPFSYGLSVLGMPGRTAYFGLLEAGRPREGETVVVSGAGGAVGSIVVQIAKLKGCRVVAIAGNAEKRRHLQEDLAVDAVINYHDYPTLEAMKGALMEAAPSGVDVYFDNVGGHITDAVFHHMAVGCRVVICGQITQYSGGLDSPALGPRFLHHVLYKRAIVTGILARDFTPRHGEMTQQMSAWIQEGLIQYRETTVQGFENLPDALSMLFRGENVGKLIVKVADIE